MTFCLKYGSIFISFYPLVGLILNVMPAARLKIVGTGVEKTKHLKNGFTRKHPIPEKLQEFVFGGISLCCNNVHGPEML